MSPRGLRALLTCLGLGALALLVIGPLRGSPVMGHDTLLHYYRVAEISALWQRGIFFSRWAPDLYLGYGYPLFQFYPPLSAYLYTALYWLLGQNAPLALNAAFALALLTACLGMYALGRELYGRTGGLLAAALYALCPHLLYQTYERGSLSDALAMAFFPLAAWALVGGVRRLSMGRLAAAAVLWAGILLSHTSASLLFAPALAILGGVACSSCEGSAHARSTLTRPLLALVTLALGLALAAFYWLPALLEFGGTQYSAAISSPAVDFRQYFARLLAWPGTLVAGSANPDLPMTTGIPLLALAVAAMPLGLARLARRRTMRDAPALAALLMGLLGLACAALASPLSTPLWERLAFLRNLQFPWRFLDTSAFALALAGGYLGMARGNSWELAGTRGGSRPTMSFGFPGVPMSSCELPRVPTSTTLMLAVVTGLGLVALAANAIPYTYPPRWQTLPVRPTLADASEAQTRYGIWGLTSWGEYAPATAGLRPEEPAFAGADEGASLGDKLRRDALPAGASVEAAGGPLAATLRLDLPAAARLTFASFYTAGCRATLDGQPLAPAADADGLITLEAPAGVHVVTVAYGRTPLQAAADGVSLAAVLVLVAGVVWRVAYRWKGRLCERSTLTLALPLRRGRESIIRCALVESFPPPPQGEGQGEGGSLTKPPLAFLAVLLCLLAAIKLAWVDRCDTPLVRHLRAGQVAGLTRPPATDLGAMRILGYQLAGPDRLTVYWQAQQPTGIEYKVRVELCDPQGTTLHTIENATPGHNVTSHWEPGEVIRDEYTLPVDAADRPIAYHVRLSVIDPGTETALPVRDAAGSQVCLVPLGVLALRPPSAPAPAPRATPNAATSTSAAPNHLLQPAVDAVFGGAIKLEFVRMSAVVQRGLSVRYGLIWRSLQALPKDRTVFVHLIRDDGTVVAGDDGPPDEGDYPTSVWEPGDVVVDRREWRIDVPAGEYLLEVGLYDPQSGERLSAEVDGQSLGDRVILGRIRVVG